MQTGVEILTEIPCFKCLFWEPIKQSSLYCNPNECEKLTKWLLKKTGDPQPDRENLKLGTHPLVRVKKEASNV
jgi:hypothetical protein